MAERWIDEFRDEIADDARALAEARAQRHGSAWSFATALARTQTFYRERIAGYCVCGSITAAERDALLTLVEAMGR
ncbi:MAG: hypothetical protein HY985_13945 [Magnetospirillum sp.]|nr:hypothetical protein [Magnetospirillum sp.]